MMDKLCAGNVVNNFLQSTKLHLLQPQHLISGNTHFTMHPTGAVVANVVD